MPRFSCPHCAKELSVSKPVPAGQKVRCPMCQMVFAAPDANGDSASAIQSHKKAAPPPLPGRRRDPDDDLDEPRKKRRPTDDYDDDDRPRSKRRAVDDDEDDDRPRSKRRADDWDDDDDDDRPSRSKRKQSRSSAGLWLGIGGGAGAFVLIFGLMGFVWPGFFRGGRGGGGGAAQTDLLAFIPADANIALGVDLQQSVDDVGKLREMLQAMPGGPPPAELDTLTDLLKNGERILVGMNVYGVKPTGGVIYRAKTPYDPEKVRKLMKNGQPKTVAGKQCYTEVDSFLGFADDRTIVLGSNNMEAEFTRALGNRTPVVSADLQAQIQAISSADFWGVALNQGKLKQGLDAVPAQQLKMMPGAADIVNPLKNAKGFNFTVSKTPAGAKLSLGATCASAADAGTVQTKLDEFWKQGGKMFLNMGQGIVMAQPQGQALGGLFDEISKSFAVNRNDALVFASVEFSTQTMKALKEQSKQLPFGMGGGVAKAQPQFRPKANPKVNPKFNPPGNAPASLPGKTIFSKNASLKKSDPKDKITNSPFRKFDVNLEAGKKYAIDMTSTRLDAYLRLELRGQQVAFDDNSGGGVNARILFTPTETAVHQILATSTVGSIGIFKLTVTELGGP